MKKEHLLILLLVACIFAAVAPTLSWLEFTSGMEDVNVATSMEIVEKNDFRTWMMPTMNGEIRLRKPPFSHWLTALGIMSSDDPAWGARWPALLASCLMLLAIYDLGRTIESSPSPGTPGEGRGGGLGLLAALIAASSILFLWHCRAAQYDVYLSLFVILTNCFIARALLTPAKWAWTAAAIFLALSILTKGPVAIVETIIPWSAWAAIAGLRPRTHLHLSIITLIALALCLPWAAYLILHLSPAPLTDNIRQVIKIWAQQSTVQVEAGYEQRSRWYDYLTAQWTLFPWIVWYVAGIFLTIKDGLKKPIGAMLMLLILPLIVMSFFAVRRDRYMIPMLGPAAILAARGMIEHLRNPSSWKLDEKTAVIAHWLIVAAIAIGLPIAGARYLRTLDHKPWYTHEQSLLFASLMAAITLSGILLHRKRPIAMPIATMLVMLIFSAVYILGYRDSESGRSAKPLAQSILAAYPDALVYNGNPSHKSAPIEMSIYLRRPVWDAPPDGIPPSPLPRILLLPGDAAAPVGAEKLGLSPRGDWAAWKLK